MTSSDIRRYEMLVRVRDFGIAQSALFPPASLGSEAFAAVAKAVDDLTGHAASQYSGRGAAREGAASKAAAREALRDDLEAIARTARAIALDDPGFEDKFRSPRSNGDAAVLSAARAFARDAASLRDRFLTHDMPPDFIEDLEQAIKDFELAIQETDASKGTAVAAGASIEAAMEAGLNAIRRLDAIVPNRLGDDGPTFAVWERVRRVEYPSSRAKSDAPTPQIVPGTGAIAAGAGPVVTA